MWVLLAQSPGAPQERKVLQPEVQSASLVVIGLTCAAQVLGPLGRKGAQGEEQTVLPRQVPLPGLGVSIWRWRRRAPGPMGRRGLPLASDGPSSWRSPARLGSGGVRLLPADLPIVVLVLRKRWSLVTASDLWGCKAPAVI